MVLHKSSILDAALCGTKVITESLLVVYFFLFTLFTLVFLNLYSLTCWPTSEGSVVYPQWSDQEAELSEVPLDSMY